jgi:hypothetical protein
VTVRHNPPVSGVAAFGSQDLGFKTSINRHYSLLLLLYLALRASLVCVSSPPRPAVPKCNRDRFCHRKCRDRFCQWIKMQNYRVKQTHARTNRHSEFIYKIHSLCQGEQAPTLVLSPFWLRPLNKHEKPKIRYIIWPQRLRFSLRTQYLHYLKAS